MTPENKGIFTTMFRHRMPRFKFIGCEIIYREACFLAATGPYQVDVEFLLKGLHDVPREGMLSKIQAAVDSASADGRYETILLGYCRCNDGLVGLTAREIPLVIPRAHDCITFFFGSRKAYMEYFHQHPGTYYLTTGWVERNTFGDAGYSKPAYGMEGILSQLGLSDPYDVLVEKYGKENADYLVETLGCWQKNYSKALYLQMDACQDEEPFINDAREEASRHNWGFDMRKGDWTLLRKLFFREWDDDFVVVLPGQAIVARNDEEILGVQDV